MKLDDDQRQKDKTAGKSNRYPKEYSWDDVFNLLWDDIEQAEALYRERPEVFKNTSKWGEEPFHFLVIENHMHIVRPMLSWGYSPNTPNEAGNTPLSDAVGLSNFPMARLLLEHGAEVNVVTPLFGTPLHKAASHGDAEMAKLLLEFKADPNIQDNLETSALHEALQWNHLNVARLMLEVGADPNAGEHYGKPMLHALAGWATTDGFRLLAEFGANLNIQDEFGGTVLNELVMVYEMEGKAQQAWECMLTLLQAGIDPNLRGHYGWTVLHDAALGWHRDVMDLLIEFGADRTMRDEGGETADDLLRARQAHEADADDGDDAHDDGAQ